MDWVGGASPGYPGPEPRKMFVRHGAASQAPPSSVTPRTGSSTPGKRKNQMIGEDYSFSDIVDQDMEAKFTNYISDDLTGSLLDSDPFAEQYSTALSALDRAFLMMFIVEIGFKFYNGVGNFFKVGWNIFDLLIVFVALVGSAGFVSSGRVLRVFRVLSAFRSLRAISALRGLQIIVKTVTTSIPDLANVLLLLVIIMFVFSIVGQTIFSDVLPDNFGNLGYAMFSLFTTSTQDGWASVSDAFPVAYRASSAIYYTLYIILGPWVMVNLIVGIIVTNLQNTFKELKKVKQSKTSKLTKKAKEQSDKPLEALLINKVKPQVFAQQKSLETPDITRLTPANLSTYFLCISAMEDNLREFQEIKAKLMSLLADVKEINVEAEIERLNQSDSEEEGNQKAPIRAGGDVLSELIQRARLADKEAEKRKLLREKVLIERKRRMEEARMEGIAKAERAQQWIQGMDVAPPTLPRMSSGLALRAPRPASATRRRMNQQEYKSFDDES